MYCSKCGTKLEEGKCPNCKESTAKKSRLAAVILSLIPFTACFGVAQFYLGNKNKGIMYILLTIFTFGIGAVVIYIISILDGLKILNKEINYDFNGNELKDDI